VRKWRRRIAQLPDDAILYGHSRARKTPSHQKTSQIVEARILELRRELTAQLGRIAGQRTILFYLHEDETLKQEGVRVPTSQATIWRILNDHHAFQRPKPRQRRPVDRPPPLSEWEIDFSDVVTATDPHPTKQAHLVESFNVVDRGTSIAIDSQASDCYDAEYALLALTSTFIRNGLPQQITCDRDPRFVGSWSAEGYPTAFMRYVLSLGIHLDICPPRRADLKPFVERYQRTVEHEWILIHRPSNVQQSQELLEEKRYFYNAERPHQGRSCNNRPPYVAFPRLPPLPHLPETIDPDGWLRAFHQHVLDRRVTSNGSIQAGKDRYYISRKLQGQRVVIRINADEKHLHVFHRRQLFKTMPIKSLYHGEMDFADYLDMMRHEARAEWRQLLYKKRRS